MLFLLHEACPKAFHALSNGGCCPRPLPSVCRCCGHAASASRVCGFPYYHLGYLKKYKFWKATFLLTTGTRSGMGGQTKHKCGQGP
jgi:hypothetical protein